MPFGQTRFWESTCLMNRLGANPALTRLSSCQSRGRWLVRNGLQNGKEQQEVFTGLERLDVDSEIVFQRKAQTGWETKIGPLCPWLGMSWESCTSAQGVQVWRYFTCSTCQKCKGKIPLSPLKLGRTNLIHFPKEPFVEEHCQCGWQVTAEGSMAGSVGWVWNSSCTQSQSDWVMSAERHSPLPLKSKALSIRPRCIWNGEIFWNPITVIVHPNEN